ncbi:MAG: tetratricopeptide repeat protein [Pedobacter sp.]|nr:tetratricopeptide repeat protein [Pedobacter sp.]
MQPSRPRSALFLALALASPALALAQEAGSATAPAAASPAVSDPLLAKAEKLLAQRQPKSAYELLAPQEDERAGDPDYDYLLGLAALESGEASAAAFAFERCLSVDPKNGPCRVQMARAHLALGENSSARLELETVQQTSPPAEVQALVAQYLGALTSHEADQKRHIGAYAQIGLGYDSNVSSTTPETQIALPAFGGLPFLLSGVSTQESDSFRQVEAGANFEYSLDPAWALIGDASVNSRSYDDIDVFNTLVGAVAVGASYQAGPHALIAKLQTETYQLDHDPFRNLYGLLTQYQYAFSDMAAISGYAQGSRLDYHSPGTPNSDRYTLGGGYSSAFNANLSPTLYVGLYGGQELSDGELDSLSQDFYGLRLGGSLGLASNMRLTGSLSIEQRKFGGPDPLFLETREDTGTDLSVGLVYKIDRNFSVKPTYSYSNNHSNIVLSDYDRHLVSIDFRYDM